MTPINEKALMKKMTIVLEKGDIKVGVVKIDEGGGEESLVLYIVKGDRISKAIKLSFNTMHNKISQIKNFESFTHKECVQILRNIEACRKEMATLPKIKGSGLQRDDTDETIGFVGAYGVDKTGEVMAIDESGNVNLHKVKGTVEEYVATLKEFVRGSIERQILILGILASVLCPIVKQNILIGLCGDTSTGKTSVAKYGISMYARVKDRKTYKTFNATENSILASLADNRGIPNLIDDTSLSMSKGMKFEKFLYCLTGGEERSRLGKDYQFIEGREWYTTTIMTSEENLLERCQDDKNMTDTYGIVGRVILIDVKKDTMCSSVEECKKIQKITEEQYGLVGMAYVEWLLKNKGIDKLENLYSEELKSLHRESDEENVIRRVQDKLALLTLTGKLFEEAFDVKFNIEGVKEYVMETSKKNLEAYRDSQPKSIIKNEVYRELVDYAKENLPEFVDEEKVFIPSKVFKAFKREEGIVFKERHIRKVLLEAQLLEINDGESGYIKTYKGKSIRGIALRIKK